MALTRRRIVYILWRLAFVCLTYSETVKLHISTNLQFIHIVYIYIWHAPSKYIRIEITLTDKHMWITHTFALLHLSICERRNEE